MVCTVHIGSEVFNSMSLICSDRFRDIDRLHRAFLTSIGDNMNGFCKLSDVHSSVNGLFVLSVTVSNSASALRFATLRNRVIDNINRSFRRNVVASLCVLHVPFCNSLSNSRHHGIMRSTWESKSLLVTSIRVTT